jgi:hypothetical protein
MILPVDRENLFVLALTPVIVTPRRAKHRQEGHPITLS